MPTYQYTTRSPRANTYQIDDVDGHRFGHKIRRDITAKDRAHAVTFMPYCECGAKCEKWFGSKKLAKQLWHDVHVREVEKQQQLPL